MRYKPNEKRKIILVAVLLLSLISTCTMFRSAKSSPDPPLAPPPVEWNKMYDEGSASLKATGLQQTVDGGFILFGTEGVGLLVKTDSLGNLLWNKTYGEYWLKDQIGIAPWSCLIGFLK